MISVCLPVHDEAETLPRLYERLHAVLSPYGAYEILFIDDGSRDDSFAVMQALHARDPNVKILRLSRNFGHQIAITAGCEAARGDAVIL
ncbi:MAG: glycosyltransferase, partial [Deltaproteobacteria bacterium]